MPLAVFEGGTMGRLHAALRNLGVYEDGAIRDILEPYLEQLRTSNSPYLDRLEAAYVAMLSQERAKLPAQL